MRSSPSHNWLFFFGVLPLLLVCASGQRVSADCGNYVYFLPEPNAYTNRELPPHPIPTCTDASCHQPLAILAQLPSPPAPVQHLDAFLRRIVTASHQSLNWTVGHEDVTLVRGHLTNIFHPRVDFVCHFYLSVRRYQFIGKRFSYPCVIRSSRSVEPSFRSLDRPYSSSILERILP